MFGLKKHCFFSTATAVKLRKQLNTYLKQSLVDNMTKDEFKVAISNI